MFRRFSTLQIALAVSLGLHAALLTVRFVAPEQFNRVFHDTPLEVILVNASSEQAPDKAQAIAQKNLAGGGDAEKGRATSPLPASAQARMGDALEDEERRVEALKEQQSRMLAQLRRQLAQLPPPEPKSEKSPQAAIEREEKRRALIQTLAEIERRINEENARPRKRYVSPATREEPNAIYYDELRRKIEDRGTTHFPEAGGRKLYGELTMVITVNHDGRVLATEVVQTSGQSILDQKAQAIVRSLSFGRFSPAIRRHMDQMVVVSKFRFTQDHTLQAKQMSATQ